MENSDKHMDIELLTRFFSGEADPDEVKWVEEWKSRSESNRREFEDLLKTWEGLGKTSIGQRIDIDREWHYLQGKIHNSTSSGSLFLKRFTRIAAAVILLLVSTWFIYDSLQSDVFRSPYNETREVILADGSVITLNADSRLELSQSFNEAERRVMLKGEAFFEVSRNPDVPFIIEIDEAEVKVLGTSFNVKAYKNSDRIEVTVAEGKVSIYDRSETHNKVEAVGGEKAEFVRNKRVIRKTLNEDVNYNAWKTRVLVFDNDPMQNVVSTISDVYHTPILLSGDDLEDCPVTVKFINKDIKTVLNVLESTLDITIEEKDGQVLITGPGC